MRSNVSRIVAAGAILCSGALVAISALTGAPMPQHAPGDGGIASGNPEPCGPVSYNRSVDSIGFEISSAGNFNAIVNYSFVVSDTAGAAANLDAEIQLQILSNGTVIFQTMFPGAFDFVSNDAITCAVTCASDCGSIFGDGVCSGCGCNYSRTATFPLATPILPGQTVIAKILPVGSPEPFVDDDELEITFGQPGVKACCPHDFNGDGDVGPFDLGELLANWGPCPKAQP